MMHYRKHLSRLCRVSAAAACGMVMTLCIQTAGRSGNQPLAAPAFASNHSPLNLHDVYVGGQSVGIRLRSSGIMVVGFQRVGTQESPGLTAGLKTGDMIERVNGTTIQSIDGLKQWLETHPSATDIDLSVRRSDTKLTLPLKLVRTKAGDARLGLYVRDKTSGVGTLTFYDPQVHRYGALGHVITDADTGRPIPGRGDLYSSEVFGIVKGTVGHPGEKRGRFVQTAHTIGSIDENTPYGVFGQMNSAPSRGQLLHVARPNQIHTGPAQILTVIKGQQVQAFDVNIETTTSQSHPATKSMVIHVVDDTLLSETGGIVQGMSGSPILQDGKLIGAVTHVFVSDPTRGYGVYAAWMLEEADDGPDEDETAFSHTLQAAFARAEHQVFRRFNLSNFVVKQQSTAKSIS